MAKKGEEGTSKRRRLLPEKPPRMVDSGTQEKGSNPIDALLADSKLQAPARTVAPDVNHLAAIEAELGLDMSTGDSVKTSTEIPRITGIDQDLAHIAELEADIEEIDEAYDPPTPPAYNAPAPPDIAAPMLLDKEFPADQEDWVGQPILPTSGRQNAEMSFLDSEDTPPPAFFMPEPTALDGRIDKVQASASPQEYTNLPELPTKDDDTEESGSQAAVYHVDTVTADPDYDEDGGPTTPAGERTAPKIVPTAIQPEQPKGVLGRLAERVKKTPLGKIAMRLGLLAAIGGGMRPSENTAPSLQEISIAAETEQQEPVIQSEVTFEAPTAIEQSQPPVQLMEHVGVIGNREGVSHALLKAGVEQKDLQTVLQTRVTVGAETVPLSQLYITAKGNELQLSVSRFPDNSIAGIFFARTDAPQVQLSPQELARYIRVEGGVSAPSIQPENVAAPAPLPPQEYAAAYASGPDDIELGAPERADESDDADDVLLDAPEVDDADDILLGAPEVDTDADDVDLGEPLPQQPQQDPVVPPKPVATATETQRSKRQATPKPQERPLQETRTPVDGNAELAQLNSFMKKFGFEQFRFGPPLLIRRAPDGNGFEIRYTVKQSAFRELTPEFIERLGLDFGQKPRPITWSEYVRALPEGDPERLQNTQP